ncbi:adenylate kinase/UMP-CMP kinase [Kipferlia bialata]|uniref:Adenylate kinase/UMP-CMP kinase n=1 Tax=Kipferlia bialata TaxID=797122 RepID=A0A9K3GDQ9_9EUKA|nr:adenylate kinase/UMP-CMP kinase [Kipferlia bialata]|eukprot:g825.t1
MIEGGGGGVIFFLGPPASGKTTQAKALASSLPGGQYVDVDELLRTARPPVADTIRAARASNQAVPVAVYIRLLISTFAANPSATFVVDGYPVSIEHATLFDAQVTPPKCVVVLEAAETDIQARMPYGAKTVLSIADSLRLYREQGEGAVRYYDTQQLTVAEPAKPIKDTTKDLKRRVAEALRK